MCIGSRLTTHQPGWASRRCRRLYRRRVMPFLLRRERGFARCRCSGAGSLGLDFHRQAKSITSSNEEKQLRLGLGQILRYAFEMRKLAEAIPVLVLEHAPIDPSWLTLCRELNVILTWPSHF